MAEKNAYVTLKDHKENFENNPKFRLINPAKSELGKVSKVILDNINNRVKSSIKVNQWKNSYSVIDWFKSVNNKPNHMFLSFDIVDFYPSITEELLDKVISWAKTIVPIPDDHIAVIKHARKSLLFHENKTWVKRNNESMFDVTMGSYDGAEICELVGLFILSKLEAKFGKNQVGLYRDDGLAILKARRARSADIARKELHAIFNDVGFKITAEVNHHVVNFLDLTLDLKNGTFSPFRKPNNEPLYVDRRSNHPPSIINQIPSAINKRISSLSSDQASFDSAAPFYEDALKRSNYDVSLQYVASDNSSSPPSTSRRRRNIIWFNPPFSKTVRTNVGRKFLQLIDKHFPSTNPLHKIFNRNTVKVSYSCMENVKAAISRHNHRLSTRNPIRKPAQCNCQRQDECPLNGKCKEDNMVYKAKVTTDDGNTKEYIGMTANPFKERYANHKTSFNLHNHSSDTKLSKYVWSLKQSRRNYNIKWSILRRASAYTPGGKRCGLCLEEKLCILKAKGENSLNTRSEFYAKCCHKEKFSAYKFKPMTQG